jgi:hypothetical protein
MGPKTPDSSQEIRRSHANPEMVRSLSERLAVVRGGVKLGLRGVWAENPTSYKEVEAADLSKMANTEADQRLRNIQANAATPALSNTALAGAEVKSPEFDFQHDEPVDTAVINQIADEMAAENGSVEAGADDLGTPEEHDLAA